MKCDASVNILYNKNGEVLLQHRTDDAPYLPGGWAFFGGGIDSGENPQQASDREAIEELNYIMKNSKMVFEQKYKDHIRHGIKYIFIEPYDESQELELLEGQGMKWASFDDARELLTVDHDRAIIGFLDENNCIN